MTATRVLTIAVDATGDPPSVRCGTVLGAVGGTWFDAVGLGSAGWWELSVKYLVMRLPVWVRVPGPAGVRRRVGLELVVGGACQLPRLPAALVFWSVSVGGGVGARPCCKTGVMDDTGVAGRAWLGVCRVVDVSSSTIVAGDTEGTSLN